MEFEGINELKAQINLYRLNSPHCVQGADSTNEGRATELPVIGSVETANAGATLPMGGVSHFDSPRAIKTTIALKAAEAAEAAEATAAYAHAKIKAALITYSKKKRTRAAQQNPLFKMTNTNTIPKGSFASILAAPLTQATSPLKATIGGKVLKKNTWNISSIPVKLPAPPLITTTKCDLFRDKEAFDALLTARVEIRGYDKKNNVPKEVDLWFATFEYDTQNTYPVPSISDATLETIKGWYEKCGLAIEVDKTNIKVPATATEAMAYMDGKHGLSAVQVPLFMGYVPELVKHEQQKQLMTDASAQFNQAGAPNNPTLLNYTKLENIYTPAFSLSGKNKLCKVVEKQILALIERIDEEYDTVFVSMMDYETDAKQMTNLIKKIKSCHPTVFDSLAVKFDDIYDIDIEMACATYTNSEDVVVRKSYTLSVRPAVERRFEKMLEVCAQIAKYDMEIVKRHKMGAILSGYNTVGVPNASASSSNNNRFYECNVYKFPDSGPKILTTLDPDNKDYAHAITTLFTAGFETIEGVSVEKVNNYTNANKKSICNTDETIINWPELMPHNARLEDKAEQEKAIWGIIPYKYKQPHMKEEEIKPYEIGTTLLNPAEYPSVYDELNQNNYPTLYTEIDIGGKLSKIYPHLNTASFNKINDNIVDINTTNGVNQPRAIHIVLINPVTLHTVVEEIILSTGDMKELAEIALDKFNAPEFGFKKLFYYITGDYNNNKEIGESIKQQFEAVCHYSAVEINRCIERVVNEINTCRTRAEIAALRGSNSAYANADACIKEYITRAFSSNALLFYLCQSNPSSSPLLSGYYNGPFEKVVDDTTGATKEYNVKLADVIAHGVDASGKKLATNYALKGKFEKYMKANGWTVTGIGANKVCKLVIVENRWFKKIDDTLDGLWRDRVVSFIIPRNDNTDVLHLLKPN